MVEYNNTKPEEEDKHQNIIKSIIKINVLFQKIFIVTMGIILHLEIIFILVLI